MIAGKLGKAFAPLVSREICSLPGRDSSVHRCFRCFHRWPKLVGACLSDCFPFWFHVASFSCDFGLNSCLGDTEFYLKVSVLVQERGAT